MIWLLIKNLKFKIPSKKLSLKYIKSFRIKGVIEAQAYRLILFSFYRIYSIFYILFLESYKRRPGVFVIPELTFLKLINNKEEYKIKEILDKIIKKKKFIITLNSWDSLIIIINKFLIKI